MNDATYAPLYAAFAEPAKNHLVALSDLIRKRFGRELTDVKEIDHDSEKGFCFGAEDSPDLFVELILTDGDERGFEGVGLLLTCTPLGDGVVWSPFNYSESVGTQTAEGVVERLQLLDGLTSSLAETIQQKWIDFEVEAATSKVDQPL